ATTANFMWLIRYAINNGIRMRAMGSGWSLSEVAVCEGGVVDTKSLRLSFALRNSFVAPQYLNKGGSALNLFFVQCGMSMLQINEKLEAAGRSLKASGASNGQSIAGCIGTGTHGAAFRTGAPHDSVLGLHIITGPDRHVWLERGSNPVASNDFINWLGAEKISNDDIFNAALVSFGSFGFIHGVLLETEPIFLLEEHYTGMLAFNVPLTHAINNLDFNAIADKLPYPAGTPGKEAYHFEIMVNPHQFEKDNPQKGVYARFFYKTPYRTDYPKRRRDDTGYQYGDDVLGLVQTILDSIGPTLSAALIPAMVNKLLPLVYKPQPVAYGTIGETFVNTRFRGKAASMAIGFHTAFASRVVEEITAINKQTPFPGAVSLRYVKGTVALLGFTKFPVTCVLELDGVDAKVTREFYQKLWNRLEVLQIPFTVHWGKINSLLNAQRVRQMYSEPVVNRWIACRQLLLDANTRKVFTNVFMERVGLAT
ncbi:MAG: FAD-binding protein, partial [Bacteroidota bacterium]|nr:FAD-binding protein [Bacteroidota bacterium]